MKLRTKVLLGLLAMFVAAVASFFVASRTLLMDGYLAVEREQTARNVLRVSDALKKEAGEVTRGDWAAWDDAYQFVASHDPRFVRANLDRDAFRDLDVDTIAFFDSSGSTVWARTLDPASGALDPLSDELTKQLRPGSALLQHKSTRDERCGLLMLPSGPVLVSSRPICTSEYTGPVRGTLVMVRRLSMERMGRIASLVHLIFRLEPIRTVDAVASLDEHPSRPGAIVVRPISPQVVAGQVILQDVYGRPAARLRIELPRSVFWEGRKSAASMLAWILAVSTGFALTIVILVERVVLRRTARLSTEVANVSISGNPSLRVTHSGSDEIAGLAMGINRMLASIEERDLALRESEEQARHAMELHEVAARRFQELFDGIPVACFAYDADGIVYEWNRECERLWERPAHLVVFRSMFDTIVPRDKAAEARAMLQRAFAGEHLQSIEWHQTLADGGDLWLLMSSFPMRGASGDIVGVICASVDITERKRADAKLAESEARFRASLESLQNGVIVVDSNGTIEVCNPKGAAILGLEIDQVIGRCIFDPGWSLVSSDGAELSNREYPAARSLTLGETCEDIVVGFRSNNGDIVWLSVNAAPIIASGAEAPSGAVASFSDITDRLENEREIQRHLNQIQEYSIQLERRRAELAEANSKLAVLALTDALTGLANQRAFRETLDRHVAAAERTGRPLSLLLLDVDNFKSFNDTFGHQAGDDVLARVGRILATAGRESDLPARYGGEEFVVLLPDTDHDHAVEAAERLRAAIQENTWELRPVTASFGAATLRPGDDSAALLRDADRAMYVSKKAGRNRVTHYDEDQPLAA